MADFVFYVYLVLSEEMRTGRRGLGAWLSTVCSVLSPPLCSVSSEVPGQVTLDLEAWCRCIVLATCVYLIQPPAVGALVEVGVTEHLPEGLFTASALQPASPLPLQRVPDQCASTNRGEYASRVLCPLCLPVFQPGLQGGLAGRPSRRRRILIDHMRNPREPQRLSVEPRPQYGQQCLPSVAPRRARRQTRAGFSMATCRSKEFGPPERRPSCITYSESLA